MREKAYPYISACSCQLDVIALHIQRSNRPPYVKINEPQFERLHLNYFLLILEDLPQSSASRIYSLH
jgi:hypothetical protein